MKAIALFLIFLLTNFVNSIMAADVTQIYKKKGLDQINQFLNSIGVGPTRFDERLEKAAKAHYNYVQLNQEKIGAGLPPEQALLAMHNEDPSLPGFIGQEPTDQAAYFGFTASEGFFVGNTFGTNRCNDRIIENAIIIALTSSFIHRSIIVNPGLEAVGFHIDSNLSGENCNVTFFYSQKYFPTTRQIMHYPTASTKPVPIQMQPEVPFVTGTNFEAGFPITVQLFDSEGEEESLVVSKASLTDSIGKKVPFYIIDSKSEGLTGHYAKSLKMAGIIPKEVLKKNHTYSVSLQVKANGKEVFNKSWKFQTGNKSIWDFYNQGY
ncbi:MAG: hypothetical protein N3A69_16620 [Leptospiraceae bacterium]|nr:hypothetical protein [Leptospiraceae bacterium]